MQQSRTRSQGFVTQSGEDPESRGGLVIRAVEHQSIWCSQPLSLACSINDTVNDTLLYLRVYLNGWLPDRRCLTRTTLAGVSVCAPVLRLP
jgi:hypothetical protein